MKIHIFLSILLSLVFSGNSKADSHLAADALFYSDYRAIQRVLRDETKRVDKLVSESNRRHINQIAKYGKCRSNSWRAAFEVSLAELNDRRNELNEFKKNALKTKGEMNATWLNEASDFKLSSVSANQPITDFVIWYENFSSDMRQGPFQELELYILAQNKLSDAYDRMAEACNGNTEAAKDTDLWVLTVRGLIREVSGVLGSIS